MPYIHINGINLYVEIEGEGEPLLLIHGLGGNTTQLHAVRSWLSPSFRTIAYDCRGHGRSDKPDCYTLEDHIRDALVLLDELGIERAHIMGVSGGSYIAQGAAAAAPDRVRSLILVVTKAHGAKSSLALFWERYAEEAADLNEAEKLRFFIDRVFAPGFLEKVDPALVKAVMRPEPALSPEQTASASRAFEGFDLRPVLGRIKAPTLIINGKWDGLNRVEWGREAASYIPQAVFVEMPHSGHAPSLEEPEAFQKLVSDFLKTAIRGAAGSPHPLHGIQ